MEQKIDIEKLSMAEQDALLNELKRKRTNDRNTQREAYEALKRDFVTDVLERACEQAACVEKFYRYLVGEVDGFRQIMAEYGNLKDKQMGFSLVNGDWKIEVKASKVKKFDERADMAAQRLIAFFKDWIKGREKGTDDPVYQLAMMAIERNKKGDLDYKQVSNLYKLETGFSHPEYSAIMDLFRESHIIEGTATHFYFFNKDEMGVWRKIEVSFNML